MASMSGIQLAQDRIWRGQVRSVCSRTLATSPGSWVIQTSAQGLCDIARRQVEAQEATVTTTPKSRSSHLETMIRQHHHHLRSPSTSHVRLEMWDMAEEEHQRTPVRSSRARVSIWPAWMWRFCRSATHSWSLQSRWPSRRTRSRTNRRPPAGPSLIGSQEVHSLVAGLHWV